MSSWQEIKDRYHGENNLSMDLPGIGMIGVVSHRFTQEQLEKFFREQINEAVKLGIETPDIFSLAGDSTKTRVWNNLLAATNQHERATDTFNFTAATLKEIANTPRSNIDGNIFAEDQGINAVDLRDRQVAQILTSLKNLIGTNRGLPIGLRENHGVEAKIAQKFAKQKNFKR